MVFTSERGADIKPERNTSAADPRKQLPASTAEHSPDVRSTSNHQFNVTEVGARIFASKQGTEIDPVRSIHQYVSTGSNFQQRRAGAKRPLLIEARIFHS